MVYAIPKGIKKYEIIREKFCSFLENIIPNLIKGTVLNHGEVTYLVKRKSEHVWEINKYRYYINPFHYIEIKKNTNFIISEKALIETIVEQSLATVAYESKYGEELAQGITDLAVAKCVSEDHQEFIKTIFEIYNSWAFETYEGNRISHTMGIEPSAQVLPSDTITLSKVARKDSFKILGSSYDSIAVFNSAYYLQNIHTFPGEELAERDNKTMAPLSFSHIAAWTQGGNIAISLTRNGEILVFKSNELLFAKRRRIWRSFPHSYITRYKFILAQKEPIEKELKRQIYLTCLDAAFSRSGACIGVISTHKKPPDYIAEKWRLDTEHWRTDIYRKLIGDRKFTDLSRSLRAELCAIDGATVIDREGHFVCVGTILTPHGQFDGGGRTAAAYTLGRDYLGIKVSNDGGVTVFRGLKEHKFEWA